MGRIIGPWDDGTRTKLPARIAFPNFPSEVPTAVTVVQSLRPDLDVTISVIVPAYNCRTMIDRSLPPLLEMQRRGEICEIIVVDDGSTDDTAAAAAAAGARVIPCEGRRGPAAARNLGALQARGNIL